MLESDTEMIIFIKGQKISVFPDFCTSSEKRRFPEICIVWYVSKLQPFENLKCTFNLLITFLFLKTLIYSNKNLESAYSNHPFCKNLSLFRIFNFNLGQGAVGRGHTCSNHASSIFKILVFLSFLLDKIRLESEYKK